MVFCIFKVRRTNSDKVFRDGVKSFAVFFFVVVSIVVSFSWYISAAILVSHHSFQGFIFLVPSLSIQFISLQSQIIKSAAMNFYNITVTLQLSSFGISDHNRSQCANSGSKHFLVSNFFDYNYQKIWPLIYGRKIRALYRSDFILDQMRFITISDNAKKYLFHQ